jgi:hypothetical protein
MHLPGLSRGECTPARAWSEPRLTSRARISEGARAALALMVLAAVALAPVAAARAETADAPVIVRTVTCVGSVADAGMGVAVAERDGGSVWVGTAFDLAYGPGLAGQTAARQAFNRAAQQWARVLGDEVTIRIAVDFAALSPGILGSTNATILYGDYDEVRDLIAAGAEAAKPAEAALAATLPTAAQFSAYLPAGFGMDGSATLSQANYLAVGGERLTDNEGSITFSSNYAWDFDPSDGIDAGKYDFQGAAAHEIGHVLGFLSEVDYVDFVLSEGETAGDVWPTAMDLFRFDPADVAGPGFDFTAAPRNLTPGGDHVFYTGTGVIGMSTGRLTGNGQQASHWLDNLGLGIMDPTAAPGETLVIRPNDLAVFDLLGWNVVPEPATLALVALGAAVLAARRRA